MSWRQLVLRLASVHDRYIYYNREDNEGARQTKATVTSEESGKVDFRRNPDRSELSRCGSLNDFVPSVDHAT